MPTNRDFVFVGGLFADYVYRFPKSVNVYILQIKTIIFKIIVCNDVKSVRNTVE